MGCIVYLWSGVGVRWEVVDVHDLRPVVRAMDDEAPGLHGLEPGEALRHPVARRHILEDDRLGRIVAGRECDQVAQGLFIRRLPEMDCHLPLAIAVLEGGAGGVLRVERFAEIVGDAARSGLIADEAGDGGGGGHAGRLGFRRSITGCCVAASARRSADRP